MRVQMNKTEIKSNKIIAEKLILLQAAAGSCSWCNLIDAYKSLMKKGQPSIT